MLCEYHRLIEEAIEALNKLKKEKNIYIQGNPASDGVCESPLALLLSLAIDQGAISDLRETNPKMENWGRLGAFPDYLASLGFKRSTQKKDVEYWPGLPTCVMTFIPIWSPNVNCKTLVSATADKFEFIPKIGKYAWNCRKRWMYLLKEQIDKQLHGRIDAIMDFSKMLKEEPLSTKRWRDTSQSPQFC